MNRYLIILLILAFFTTDTVAQRKRRSVKKEKTEQELLAEQKAEKLRSMARAAQDIIVIDSIVVEKENFLAHYKLTDDAGKITRYYNLFVDSPKDSSYVYVNEMGDKCYYSKGDTTKTTLYTRDLIGGEWTSPSKLIGIDSNVFAKQDYPFMMPDGITFYFASTGEESIGGYDIFITRYDSETNQFFKPENIGMPFNSTANDYMFAIDEMNEIGWFVSDRNQPQGKVCIYIFIPSEIRKTYSNTKYTEEQIQALAQLHRIADTWKDGRERANALKRLADIQSTDRKKTNRTRMYFVINDNTVYLSPNDFKAAGNWDKYYEIRQLKERLQTITEALDKYRGYYNSTDQQGNTELKTEILAKEKELKEITTKIHNMEKEVRISENKYINSK